MIGPIMSALGACLISALSSGPSSGSSLNNIYMEEFVGPISCEYALRFVEDPLMHLRSLFDINRSSSERQEYEASEDKVKRAPV